MRWLTGGPARLRTYGCAVGAVRKKEPYEKHLRHGKEE